MSKRSAGILLPISSLPSPFGIGDFGPQAYRFVDFLVQAGQKIWQVLPLTIPDNVGSPYQTPSAFAGNWLLISPELLFKQRLINSLPSRKKIGKVHYPSVWKQKNKLLHTSHAYFKKNASQGQRKKFKLFMEDERNWLDDYALFMAIKDYFLGKQWHRWPKGLAKRNKKITRAWEKKLARQIMFHKYCQWLFFEQWLALKRYVNKKGIKIMGDLPFFVMHDSVDVWENQQYFSLNKNGRPTYISGVPPDYFSKRGQIWGDPQYNWAAFKRTNFRWWVHRLHEASRLYDIIRLDHFRGFHAVWVIKRSSKTAREGTWVSVPGRELFRAIKKELGGIQLIAEDLGIITHEVRHFMDELGIPGMAVLQFAFNGDPSNWYLPSNIRRKAIAYTGTHDTDTARGWIEQTGKLYERANALKYTKNSKQNFAWNLIKIGMHTQAHTFIAPMQDLLNLGSEARMNKPSTKRGNWRWRLKQGVLTSSLAQRLERLTKQAKR